MTLCTLYLLTACASTEYSKEESVFVVFKTDTFKYADLGFIYDNDKEMKVEMYSNGQAVMALEVSQSSVCMSLFECMSRQTFNTQVLSSAYPEDILDNIFRGKELFDGLNVKKIRNGFTQNIRKTGKYDIKYSVLNKQIVFRDRMNNIMIKIKRLGT